MTEKESRPAGDRAAKVHADGPNYKNGTTWLASKRTPASREQVRAGLELSSLLSAPAPTAKHVAPADVERLVELLDREMARTLWARARARGYEPDELAELVALGKRLPEQVLA